MGTVPVKFSALDNGGHAFIAAAKIGVPYRRSWRQRLLSWCPWHTWAQDTVILRCGGEVQFNFRTTYRI